MAACCVQGTHDGYEAARRRIRGDRHTDGDDPGVGTVEQIGHRGVERVLITERVADLSKQPSFGIAGCALADEDIQRAKGRRKDDDSREQPKQGEERDLR